MVKNFQTLTYDSTSPGLDSVPIDVSGGDVTPDEPYRAIRATAAGNVVVNTLKGGTTARTMAFAAGETRPMIVTKIIQSGTTATGLEGIV